MKTEEKKLEIRYCASENYVLVRKVGTFEFSDVEFVFAHIQKSEYGSNDPARIWDLSNADLSDIDAEIVKQTSSYVASQSGRINNSRVALVSAREINLAILNLYRAYAREKNKYVEVFKSLVEALDWLEEFVI